MTGDNIPEVVGFIGLFRYDPTVVTE